MRGDTDFAASSTGQAAHPSARVVVEPLLTTTTTTLSTSSDTVRFGQAVNFVARVSVNGLNPVHAGDPIVFTIDNSRTVTVPLDATGQAVLDAANLGPGHHTVTAAYAGGGVFLPSQSSPIAQDITRADPAAQVVIIAIRNRRGKLIGLRLIASLAEAAGVQPSGTVAFLLKKRTLATVAPSGGTAVLTVKPQPEVEEVDHDPVRRGRADFQPGAAVDGRVGPQVTRRISKGVREGRGGGAGGVAL